MPVKLRNSPARAFVHSPFGSRASQTSSGVITNTSIKAILTDPFAHHLALGAVWRDKCGQHHQPGVGHQAGDLPDPADVLFAVVVAEP